MSLFSANLIAFMAIVRHGTVHAAAAELHLTQTAVTQRIRALERNLRTSLFLRSRKGMKLTQEGEALLRYCKGAADLEGQALSQISGAGSEQSIHVTVAGPTSVMTSRVVDQCVALYSQWPGLYLHFIVSDATDRLALVRSGRTSAAIVPPEQVPNEMDSKTLKPDKYVLVATSKWRRRKLVDILEEERVIDFDESDSTTLNYLKKFALISRLKKSRLYVNSNEAIINLFCQGVGFGTLTQEIAKPFLNSGELITLNSGSVMEDPLAVAWYPRPEMPAYFRAIIASIK